MINHIHLIAVPQSEDALARAIGEAHRRYTRNIAIPEEELRDLRGHAHTGHPWGSATFVERLERMVGRRLRPGKPGRRSK